MSEQIIEAAASFAREVVAPNAAAWEVERRFPREAFRAAAAHGLLAVLVPERLGGAGQSVATLVRVAEQLAAACMPFTFSILVHNNLANSLARFGSSAQQALLGPMATGDRVGAFLLSEPDVGSDAAAISTRAIPIDGGYVLSGEKAWISNGAVADTLSVYAQTDPAAGWRGIGCFLVEADREGVERLPAYELMGGHALGTAGFRFENCRLDAADVLVPPGMAFKAALQGIDLARVNVAAMCCGMMRCAIDLARDQALGRQAFGVRLAEFQAVQWLIADAATDLEASRLLAYRAADTLDAGEPATIPAAHAKKFATRAALRGIADCMQAMGAAGFRAACPLGRHLASAKMAQYLDGTTEIQNVVIARDLFARSGASSAHDE